MIYWRDVYDINVPAINNERKLFFSILNQIEENNMIGQKELTSIFIKKLSSTLPQVFEREQVMLENSSCPTNLCDRHKKEHENFTAKIIELEESEFVAATTFADILKTFIINHIIGADLETRIYLKDTYIHRFVGFEKNESLLVDMVNRDILVRCNSYFETCI